MALIPPSLTIMGHVFFGSVWQEPLARALNVTIDEVKGWAQGATAIPKDLENEMTKIGQTRITEIHVMLEQMKKTGLARTIQEEA